MKKQHKAAYRYLAMLLVFIMSITLIPHAVLAEDTVNETPILEEYKIDGELEYNYASEAGKLTLKLLTGYINENEEVTVVVKDSKGNGINSSNELSFQSSVKVTTPGAIGVESSSLTTPGAISIELNTNGKAPVGIYSVHVETTDKRKSNEINFEVIANEEAVLQSLVSSIETGIEEKKNIDGKLVLPLEHWEEDLEVTLNHKKSALYRWIRDTYFRSFSKELEEAGLPMLHMLQGYWGDGDYYYCHYGFALDDDTDFSYNYNGEYFSDLTVLSVRIDIVECKIVVEKSAIINDAMYTLQDIAEQALEDHKPIPLYVKKSSANAAITTEDKIKALEVWAWETVVENMSERAPLDLIELKEVKYNEIRDEFFIYFRFKDNNDYGYRGSTGGNFRSESFNFIVEVVSGGNGSGSGSDSSSSDKGTPNTLTTNDVLQDQLKNNKKPVVTLKNNNTCELNEKTISSVIEKGMPLTVNKDNMSMVLTPETITAAGLNDAKKVTISMTPVSKTTDLLAKDNADVSFLSNVVYDIRIKADGKEITSFEKPIELYYDFKNTTISQSDKDRTTGARFYGDNKYSQLGGTWNKNVFSFHTSGLSQYGVITSNSLVTISTQINSPSFEVNGNHQMIDAAPVIVGGYTMVPVRFIAEAFGAEVDWNEITETVKIQLDGQQLSLKIGNVSEGMNVAPFIENERTMVPLRYISEQLGGNVLWDDGAKTVTIYR